MRGLPPMILAARYLLLITWLTFYLYFFNFPNRITGINEDRVNKPDRPIPSGRVTLKGARRRWVVAVLAFLGIAIYEQSLLPQTLSWIATTAIVCLTSYGNHWFGKNCIGMAMEGWAMLGASWKAIAPATPTSDARVYALAACAALTMHIQDLRDIEGDAAVGRKTLPLIFGDTGSRLIITFFALPAACGILALGGIF